MCESGEQHLLVRQLAIRQAARPEDVCQAQLKTRRVFKRFGLRSWPRFFVRNQRGLALKFKLYEVKQLFS